MARGSRAVEREKEREEEEEQASGEARVALSA
jgi:hypothetical protein